MQYTDPEYNAIHVLGSESPCCKFKGNMIFIVMMWWKEDSGMNLLYEYAFIYSSTCTNC